MRLQLVARCTKIALFFGFGKWIEIPWESMSFVKSVAWQAPKMVRGYAGFDAVQDRKRCLLRKLGIGTAP